MRALKKDEACQTHARTQTRTHTQTRAQIHVHTDARTQTHIHTDVLTHTYVRVHIHTHTTTVAILMVLPITESGTVWATKFWFFDCKTLLALTF